MIGFTSLEDRRIRRDMIEVYKLLTGKEKIDYRQFFNFTNASYSLKGHEKKLAKDRSRLDTRKFFVQSKSGQRAKRSSGRHDISQQL